jgi:hypothetical protein
MQAPYHLNHTASPFLFEYFQGRVSWMICTGWLQTKILLDFLVFFLAIVGFKLRAYILSHSTSPIFMVGFCSFGFVFFF